MRILILGGDGMQGHQLLLQLRAHHEVRVSLRGKMNEYGHYGIFDESNAMFGVDARDFRKIERCVALFQPQAVINSIGIVKQRTESADSIASIEINALLPHRLALLCREHGARLVHLSTDCVFSGKSGCYRESDIPDPEDLYGRSKLLGEPNTAPSITLRTSIIGRELSRKAGLLEWFLSQQGQVRGYRKAIFSGFTTSEMARIIEMLLTQFPQAHGLYHVSSSPISKYDLLTLIRDHFGRAVEIKPDNEFECDRSLDSSRFRREFNYNPPAWEAMVRELQ